MTLGEEMAFRMYGYGAPRVKLYDHEKVECPVCGKRVGGRSDRHGDGGRMAGVHQHLRFKHGIKKLADRMQMLGAA